MPRLKKIERGFTLIELLVVIAIIGITSSLLLTALSRAQQKGQQIVCLSNLKQIGLAFVIYLNDHGDRFPDRRDLKARLPGGFHPWTTWPPSDPRAGWAATNFSSECPNLKIWSCPASVDSSTGNALQSAQATSSASNAPICRYWAWRFDRMDDLAAPTMLEDFWAKSVSQAVADLQAANNPSVGFINGPSDVELVVDPYFPNTVPTAPLGMSGRTIHSGGRNRIFLGGHAQFLKDARTPLR